jgi:hypothetical protein
VTATPDIENLINQERAKAREQKNQRNPVLLKSSNALTIYNSEYRPPEFIVGDLLPVGLTLAGGRPKTGKSWLALQIAVDVAMGKPALGRFHVQRAGRVVYLALEESESRTHHRLRQIVTASDIQLQNIDVIYRIAPLMTGGASQLDLYLNAQPADLVVIDTLLAFTAAHNERKDVLRGDYAEVNTLRQLAEKHKTAILCVAHTRKAAGDAVDALIGTSGASAACDSVWQLKRLATGEAALEIKGRELEEMEYELKFSNDEPFGWQVTGRGAEVGMSQERRDILLLLRQEGAQKPAAIARLLGNKNAVTVRRLLQKLAYDGLVHVQSDGTYVLVNGVNSVNSEEV